VAQRESLPPLPLSQNDATTATDAIKLLIEALLIEWLRRFDTMQPLLQILSISTLSRTLEDNAMHLFPHYPCLPITIETAHTHTHTTPHPTQPKANPNKKQHAFTQW
jgi:hypothetical protein